MHLSTFLISASLVAAVGLAGCTFDSTHSKVPDGSDGTKAQATVIRDEAQRKIATIDQELDQRLTALSFRRSQAEQKSKQGREQIAIDLNFAIQPLKAQQDQAQTTSERECAAIARENEGKPVSTLPEETARLKADMDTRKALSQQTAAGIVRDNEAKISQANAKAAKQLAEIDEADATDKVMIAKERATAENQAREKRLAVSVDSTNRLDQLGEKSAERRAETSKENQAADQEDQAITSAVRKHTDNQEAARDVSVTTVAGVVTLTGVVSNEAIKQDLATKAAQVAGVVRIDNRLTMR